MKLKKLLAAVAAGAMAISAVAVSSFTASAEGETEYASTNDISAKSVVVNYSLSTEKENDWDYKYSNAEVVVKTWNNNAEAGDWIQYGFGGSEQAQWFKTGQFVTYEGTAIENQTVTINVTEYDILNELKILYKLDDKSVFDLTINSVTAYSEANGEGDAVWTYPESTGEDPGTGEDPETPDEPGDTPATEAQTVTDLVGEKSATTGGTYNNFQVQASGDPFPGSDYKGATITATFEISVTDTTNPTDWSANVFYQDGAWSWNAAETVKFEGIQANDNTTYTVTVTYTIPDTITDTFGAIGYQIVAPGTDSGTATVKCTSYTVAFASTGSTDEPTTPDDSKPTISVGVGGEVANPDDYTSIFYVGYQRSLTLLTSRGSFGSYLLDPGDGLKWVDRDTGEEITSDTPLTKQYYYAIAVAE